MFASPFSAVVVECRATDTAAVLFSFSTLQLGRPGKLLPPKSSE